MAPSLGANVSLVLGGTMRGTDDPVDAWVLVSAGVDVLLPEASFPVLTAAVPFTVLRSSVAGMTQHLACTLGAPNATGQPRWLPSTLSTLRAVSLRLRLTVRCPTDPAATRDVVLDVPAPGVVQHLVSEVKAASTASQYSSLLVGPGAAGAVARLVAVRSLVLCYGDSAVDGLLPLPMGGECSGSARGAVVGNLVLWAAGCALMGLGVWAFAVRTGVAMRTAVEALGVPSPLLPLVVATVPSTASATFSLLWSPCAVDSAVGAVSVAMCVCPLAALAAVAVIVPRRLQQRLAHEEPPPATSSRLPRAFRTVRVALLARRVRWGAADAAPSGGTLRWERVATVVVLEYAAVWYACVDMAVLTVAGFLGAVGQSAAACRGSAVAVLALYAWQLALCAAVRPFTTLFSNVHALFTLALTTLSVACQVWYLFASRLDGADLGSLGRLLTAAAVCDLIVSGVGWLRWLVDCCDVLRACVRHAQTMLQPAALGNRHETLNAECVDHCDVELTAVAANMAALDLASKDPLWSSDGGEEAERALTDVSDGDFFGIVTAQEEAERARRTAPSDLLRHYGGA